MKIIVEFESLGEFVQFMLGHGIDPAKLAELHEAVAAQVAVSEQLKAALATAPQ